SCTRPPSPISTLFPYTTLFRSDHPCMPVAAAQGLVVLASGAVGAASATAAVLLATVLGDFVDLAGHVRAASSATAPEGGVQQRLDRKSTRLNSSHVKISYAVFC